MLSTLVNAQTFSGTGGLIPDDGVSSIDFTINVAGLPTSTSASFGVKASCIDIMHTWDSDLEISLIAPDGTIVLLTAGNGGDSDNYDTTCFDNSSPTPISSGWGPFNGIYKPQESLGYFNAGLNPNGIWTLHVFDTYPADQGTLNFWTITFDINVDTVQPFVSSNLPIVVINSGGQTISDAPKKMMDMGIIYNGFGIRNYMSDPFNNYNGKIGIEIRGSSSSMFPKKAYGFETWDTAAIAIDASLLGMPLESDWILNANYSDKSLLNNFLAYDLYNKMGMYAPRGKFVELVIDGKYKGVYTLMEKIKRDANRVNIAKLATIDTTGSQLTGGYIIKIDKSTGSGGGGFTSAFAPPNASGAQSVFFQYDYPSDVKIQPAQKTYIQNYVNTFELALNGMPLYDTTNGWRAYADEQSFINYFILNELSKNVDGYRLSTYLYKEKDTDGDKLFIGPPWDYDLAFANADYCNGSVVNGWGYNFNYVCNGDNWLIPFWWQKLMTDTIFINNLNCTYQYYRTNILDTTRLFSFIDSMVVYLEEGQQRNFNLYPILGTYVWPNPWPYPSNYAGEITEMKNWFRNRIAWLDANMPGACYFLGSNEIVKNEINISVFPNPFSNAVSIRLRSAVSDATVLRMRSADGKIVLSKPVIINGGINVIYLSESELINLSNGIYIVELSGKAVYKTTKLIKN